jgi:lipid A disaccharide synthetase
MLETALALGAGFGFLIAVGSPEAAAAVRSVLLDRPGMAERFTVVEGHTYDAVAHAKVAVVASGTATVETALLGTPMVVVYRVTRASWILGRRLVDVPFYSMVNLVLGREVVRELIQDAFDPQAVAAEVLKLLSNGEARNAMFDGFRELAGRLRAPGSDVLEGSLATKGLLASANTTHDAIERSVVVTEALLRAQPS